MEQNIPPENQHKHEMLSAQLAWFLISLCASLLITIMHLSVIKDESGDDKDTDRHS